MIPHERSLVERLQNQPFALLGINSDKDKSVYFAKQKEMGVTWRSFWNGPKGTGGPISAKWNVNSWPTIYVLDHKGVIRFKNVRGEAMDKAVDQLLDELKAESK
jgi:predicted alpha/beta hydrolase family esterase